MCDLPPQCLFYFKIVTGPRLCRKFYFKVERNMRTVSAAVTSKRDQVDIFDDFLFDIFSLMLKKYFSST